MPLPENDQHTPASNAPTFPRHECSLFQNVLPRRVKTERGNRLQLAYIHEVCRPRCPSQPKASPTTSLQKAEQLARMQSWDIMSLNAFSKQSSHCALLVSTALETRMLDILRKVTDKPEALRDGKRETSSVLSGSACVFFLFPAVGWTPGDFDFYCPYHTFSQFVSMLKTVHSATERASYRYGAPPPLPIPTPDSVTPDDWEIFGMNPPDDYSAHHAHICQRSVLHTTNATIDVLRSTDITPLTCIAAFDLTVVMNFLTADSIHVGYPHLFDRRQSLLRERAVSQSLMRRYRLRGYSLFQSCADAWPLACSGGCAPHGCCPRTTRTFGDHYSLTLRFDHRAIANGDKPEGGANMLNAQWRFGGPPCGNRDCGLVVLPVNVACVLPKDRSVII